MACFFLVTEPRRCPTWNERRPFALTPNLAESLEWIAVFPHLHTPRPLFTKGVLVVLSPR